MRRIGGAGGEAIDSSPASLRGTSSLAAARAATLIDSPSESYRLVVVCKGDSTLVTLDAHTLEKVHAVKLTGQGHEVAVDDAGRAYVPLFGAGGVGELGPSDDGVDEVDLVSGTVVRTIRLPPGSRAHDAAIGPARVLHVTAEGLSCLLTIDVSTGRVIGVESTGHAQAHMMTIAKDGTRAFTANVRPGSLSAISLDGGGVKLVELGPHVNRLSIAPDESVAYVADQERPRLAIICLTDVTLKRWVELPDVAFGTAPTPDGRHLILALRSAGRVVVLDLETLRVAGSVDVPKGPQRLVIDNGGSRAYVTCAPADVVVALDLNNLRILAQGSPGPNPDGMALTYRRHHYRRDSHAT